MQPLHVPTLTQRDAASVILFLDFDGVTHPEPCFQDNTFCRLALIEAVVRTFSAVEIVISSSWRDHYTLNELREHFSKDLRSRVVGVTPSLKYPSPVRRAGSGPAAAQEQDREIEALLVASRPTAHEREWEIETWLTANRPTDTPWLAIDDRPEWFRPNSTNLLVTDSQQGFQPRQQQTLRAMIRIRTDEL